MVTSLTGGGVQCHCVGQGLVAGLCSAMVLVPRGQKHGGLGAPEHDFGVTRAMGYLCRSEDLQGVWMDLSAGLWLISA